MEDHERIWLQNKNDVEWDGEGRLWCQDKVWPDHPEDGEPTEYVRADLYKAQADEIERLRQGQPCSHKEYIELVLTVKKQSDEIERLRETLGDCVDALRSSASPEEKINAERKARSALQQKDSE